ncbi:MAG: sirohydrochlorin cobaltochelatase [Thermodesulfobacteriota bacterium]
MEKREKVLILAAHGSSHPAAKGALERFAGRARERRPEARVSLAFTASPRPGSHPGGKPGLGLDEVLQGLAVPAHVRVLSLHVIAGGEFDRMRRTLDGFAAETGSSVEVSGPLLTSAADAPGVALALSQCLGGTADGEAAVLMGHGTTHGAQELYRALAGELGGVLPGARLGVLEAADPGDPLSIKAIARDLAARGVVKARLVPFLTVAGRHAHKDLAGGQPCSWKSVLEAHGVACEPDLAGLIEREAFAKLWLGRIALLTQRSS